jgi:flagellar biosynthetic protein FliS
MEGSARLNVADYYANVQIETAPIRRAICMLHEKCVLFISNAIDFPDKKQEFVTKAQNIITQLIMSLKIEDEVSKSLYILYEYCYALLEHSSKEKLINAGNIMAILRDTFNYLNKRPR